MTAFNGIKIGFDAKRAFTNHSGLGSYSRNIVSSLKRFYPCNSYVLFTPEKQAPGIFFNDSGFEVVTPGRVGIKFLAAFWRNFQLTGQLKYESVNLFHGLSNELPSGIHRLSIPSVVTIHDLIFLKFPGFYRPVDRLIYRSKVRYACQAATRVIAVSNQTRRDLIGLLNVPEDKIDVVYQPVSQRFFENPEAFEISAVKEKYGLHENFILSVGTIEDRKNQLNIIRAVREEGIDREIVFIGRKTGYADRLMDYIRLNRMNNQVRFISDLPDEDLPSIYALAGASVYLSKYEGFGIPVIEAMAAGCPVVASNAPCLPETSGGAALLVDPENIGAIGLTIKSVLENKEVRAELISKGKERAAFFTPENAARNLITVYSKILNFRNH